MAYTTTIGRLHLNSIVPKEFRSDIPEDQPIGSEQAQKILQHVAEVAPERYREISHAMLKLGAKASTETNSSFSLNDLKSPIDKKGLIQQSDREEAAIMANPALSPQQKERERVKLYNRNSSDMPGRVYDAALSQGSNLARMVASGARGNKGQLNSNIGADWLVLDPNNEPVPVPIKNSYSEGLSPAEYFAASYGTRLGLVSTKLGVQQSGYLNKQLAAAAHDLVVTTDDCGTDRGIPTTPDDKDNIGAVLSRATAGYPAGTPLTSKNLRDLKNKGVENMLVRSPVTCQAKGGICAQCAGIRERNRFPAIMDNLGLAAASSLTEPLSQGLMCLAEGELVRMHDYSMRPIQDVKVGEFVMGADIYGRTFGVLVTNRFENGLRPCHRTSFRSDGEVITLRSTLDHKLLVALDEPGGVFQILPVGHQATHVLAVGSGHELFPRISSEPIGELPTYDLEVDHPDHLFVLGNNLIVSNSTKHSAGVASAGSARTVSGFQAVDSLVQIPETFPGGAAIAQNDGKVTKLEPAPQGGQFMTIGDQRHYLSPEMTPSVKIGDEVEAGDALSDGIPNPSEITKHKGIGSGRYYFVEAMKNAFKANGLSANRRNIEIMSRALVNHVRVTDPEGYANNLPDDITEYQAVEDNYQPDKDTVALAPQKAIGSYLQKPALHYTIGTRITPKVAKRLDLLGEKEIFTSPNEPGFTPEHIRGMSITEHKKDFLSQWAGSGLSRKLLREVQSGDATSDIHGQSYVSGMAFGLEFGMKSKEDPTKVGY